jgi:hypothetical protein
MEPLMIILIPGLAGGLAVALLMTRLRAGSGSRVRVPLEPPSPGLINMAHIRVDGVGGLGMVAMAIVVAIFVPRIRLTMALALLLGTALAALLIAVRRRTGPLSSGGDHPGAHAMLDIDGPARAAAPPERSNSRLSPALPPA